LDENIGGGIPDGSIRGGEPDAVIAGSGNAKETPSMTASLEELKARGSTSTVSQPRLNDDGVVT